MSKVEPKEFRITTPENYKPNKTELSNALYLLGNFGFATTETDWLLDRFSEDRELVEYLNECVDRLKEVSGEPKERVFEILNTWFRYTSQADRTYVWTRP